MTRERARTVRRAVLGAWLLIAAVLLAITLLRPGLQADERSALSRLKVELYTGSGYVPGMHEEALLLWSALTALGLLQWFVLLPWVARRSRRLGDFLFRRFPGR